MTLYLDTEFNGHGGALISLALVSNKGPHCFYGVLPLPGNPHPWVAEHVIPALGQGPELSMLFRFRLSTFLMAHDNEEIVADWPHDFVCLMNAMQGETYDESWMVPCTMRLIKSGEFLSAIPHNALADAKALMYWCIANGIG